jgi:hypothetical protein
MLCALDPTAFMRFMGFLLLVLAGAAPQEGAETPVQLLVPGFSVRELPVRLTNINNLEYLPDGRLLAVGYDGRLPGGNPLDEILHILPGRHYGFPPRHPDYLPNVVDEPAVVTFGPQHQSTCGLRFNEAREGRPSFGPASWEGNALVTGESRGKLWRVPLVKTPAGYVGKPVLFACLGMLTVDLAISPQGDLVVACHSGEPDWGTGPVGRGRLFKIRFEDRAPTSSSRTWA